MKIFSIVFCSALLLSSQSYAIGFFVGADALLATAKHDVTNSSTTSGPENNDSKSDNKLNYSVNTGVRFDLLNLYASGELFYDNLKTSTSSFNSNSPSSNSDNIELDSRYGAKANLGFAILPKITPFITYGIAGVNYSNKAPSTYHLISNSNLTPLYGAGLLVDLALGFSVKASYDYQSFDIHYAESGSKNKTHLGVAKVGVIYNF